MPFGAQVDEAGRGRFRLWAPSARSVALVVEGADRARALWPMTPTGEGWYDVVIEHARPGLRYRYRIDDEIDVPDPASRFAPEGVHGPSMLVEPTAFAWRDSDWRGHAREELVIYELHIGTFTREGTYAALRSRLPELARLGVTALELMPIAAFAGVRGWGYDGVLHFAPHAPYGTPDDLKELVQQAHAEGLSVLLDVVYNHFGPEGNYLGRYARDFFTDKHKTPWGDAIDFSQPTVRRFFVENALYWLEEYHFDGLRIDAVHAIRDEGARHFVDELIDAVQEGPGRERHVHIVLENHGNEARRLLRPCVAQWNDDFHHAMHVCLTGEMQSYYANFAERPLEMLGRCLAEGFAYQGEPYGARREPRGEPSRELTPLAFVGFLQNHDQIGNRAFGERLAVLTQPDALRAGLAILLLAPHVPMLFMGEEYGATQPFLFFCDFQDALADAVREGRRNEFAGFAAFSDPIQRARIPDPNAPATFALSTLDWAERDRPGHRKWLAYVRELLALRRQAIVPLIPAINPGSGRYRIDGGVLDVSWSLDGGGALRMMANLSTESRAPSPELIEGALVFSTSRTLAAELIPWEVRVYAPSGARQ
jgi:maltooligosyltrehalose trehalohydrolase